MSKLNINYSILYFDDSGSEGKLLRQVLQCLIHEFSAWSIITLTNVFAKFANHERQFFIAHVAAKVRNHTYQAPIVGPGG